ncbi:phospholipase D-like domain-containing protein [Candidatus Thioglobus sp.]|nr:phospholipase D-like domain-containing protein [Candidatus Thioglobus sp.]MDA8981398.1 phospholipase D-like domain-containing protein [Candidatus Thioglobus sp.]
MTFNRLTIAFFTLLLSISTNSISESSQTYFKVITNSPLIFLSPNASCNTQICSELINLIGKAENSLDFAVYGLRGQKEVLNTLIAAKNRGVSIRGVIDKDVRGKTYYSDTYLLEDSFDAVKSDYEKDLNTLSLLKNKEYADKCERPEGYEGPLQCFEGKGYASKEKLKFSGDIMHNKFFIIDGEYIWTGSANISDTGTGGYNANVVASIKSKYLADHYLIEFEQMFNDGSFHRSKKKLRKQDIRTEIDSQTIELFFSPQGFAMYRGIIPLIQEAQQSVDVSMFFLTHKNVSKELVAANNRGVNIRVIIDATSATNGYSKHNYLRDNGIPVKVENWGGKMHMKSAIIDSKHLIVGSMNWTSAGESKNDENTLIVRNAIDAHSYQEFFNELWASIDNKWLLRDPLAESKDSYPSCNDTIDNDFDRFIDSKDKSCR